MLFWRDSLNSNADIVLYGCDVSSGDNGNSFIRQLSRTTEADILASVDKTGIEGDWELETAFGKVETDSIFTNSIATAYQHTLDEGEFAFVSDPGIGFNDIDFNENPFSVGEIDDENLGIFAEEGVSFEPVEPPEIEEIDFGSVEASDLGPLAEEGLDFQPLDNEDINDINFNNVPAEDLSILANQDLALEQLNTEDVEQIDFSDINAGDIAVQDLVRTLN